MMNYEIAEPVPNQLRDCFGSLREPRNDGKDCYFTICHCERVSRSPEQGKGEAISRRVKR